MRTLSTAAAAALSNGVVLMAILVEMDLTEPLCLNTSSLNLVIGGVTYFGTAGLGTIEPITESGSDLTQLSFTMAGVQPTSLALALEEPVRGKAVRMKLAIFNATTGALIDTSLRYAGTLDTMSIADARDSSQITVTSEAAELSLLRPAGIYFNDSDQQALHPGDPSLQYVNDQSDEEIVWPASTYFAK